MKEEIDVLWQRDMPEPIIEAEIEEEEVDEVLPAPQQIEVNGE